MKMIYIIAMREFKTLFLSPLAWSVLAVLQFIFAFVFLSQVESFIQFQAKLAGIDSAPGLTDVAVVPVFANAAIILLLVTPLLTMRLVCEERRNKTLSLLLSAPVSNTEIVLGKYGAVCSFLLLLVGLLTLMPLTLLVGGELDFGLFFSNVLALILLVKSFSALGLYMSCVAGHPVIAAINSFGLLLLLWILDWTGRISSRNSELFDYLSLLKHFKALQTGLISSTDVAYFLLFTSTFILLSIRRLNYDRLQK